MLDHCLIVSLLKRFQLMTNQYIYGEVLGVLVYNAGVSLFLIDGG